MLDDYKIKGQTKKIEVEIENEVAEKLATIEKNSKLTRSEITNTALKRYIATHKDYLPASEAKK